MPSSKTAGDSRFDTVLTQLDERLSALQLAVLDGDAMTIEAESNQLRLHLGKAAPELMRATQDGRLPRPLRRKLAEAGARVGAQREALARSLGALDRAIDILVTGGTTPAAVYAAHGGADRAPLGTNAQA